MKKIWHTQLVLALMAALAVGCSSSKKSEDELLEDEPISEEELGDADTPIASTDFVEEPQAGEEIVPNEDPELEEYAQNDEFSNDEFTQEGSAEPAAESGDVLAEQVDGATEDQFAEEVGMTEPPKPMARTKPKRKPAKKKPKPVKRTPPPAPEIAEDDFDDAEDEPMEDDFASADDDSMDDSSDDLSGNGGSTPPAPSGTNPDTGNRFEVAKAQNQPNNALNSNNGGLPPMAPPNNPFSRPGQPAQKRSAAEPKPFREEQGTPKPARKLWWIYGNASFKEVVYSGRDPIDLGRIHVLAKKEHI